MLKKAGAQVTVVVAPSKTVVTPLSVDFKLEVRAINLLGESATAILEGGNTIEVGGPYKFVDPKSKAVVEYKVQKITENAVFALYDGKEYEFKPQTELERFKEK